MYIKRSVTIKGVYFDKMAHYWRTCPTCSNSRKGVCVCVCVCMGTKINNFKFTLFVSNFMYSIYGNACTAYYTNCCSTFDYTQY